MDRGMVELVNTWFAASARELPWRDDRASPWAVLVSEFMLQQTQVDRVIPRFLDWLSRWPAPSALARETPGTAVRAWDRLGYPRRALWLHGAAARIAAEHGDVVPRDVEALERLPGVGPYTARAVAVFAYGDRHPVVDTNTRRVIARAIRGLAAAGAPRRADLEDMTALLPAELAEARVFNAGMMELGAVVCTARAPRCEACPIARLCEWRGAGYPDNAPRLPARAAAFEGSDRQARGRILALVREREGAVSRAAARAAAAGPGPADPAQAERALASLLADGLLVAADTGVRLP